MEIWLKRADGQVASPDEKRNRFGYLKTSPEIMRSAMMLDDGIGPLPTHLAIVRLELNVSFGLKAGIRCKLKSRAATRKKLPFATAASKVVQLALQRLLRIGPTSPYKEHFRS